MTNKVYWSSQIDDEVLEEVGISPEFLPQIIKELDDFVAGTLMEYRSVDED